MKHAEAHTLKFVFRCTTKTNVSFYHVFSIFIILYIGIFEIRGICSIVKRFNILRITYKIICQTHQTLREEDAFNVKSNRYNQRILSLFYNETFRTLLCNSDLSYSIMDDNMALMKSLFCFFTLKHFQTIQIYFIFNTFQITFLTLKCLISI